MEELMELLGNQDIMFNIILPMILITFLLYRNTVKMARNLNEMKKSCGDGCKGCNRRKVCTKPQKEERYTYK